MSDGDFTKEEMLDYANDLDTDGLGVGAAMIRNLLIDITTLESDLAECRRDAERYRWLRDPNSSVGLVIDKLTGDYENGCSIYEYRAGQELDAAIDAAIARSTKNDDAK